MSDIEVDPSNAGQRDAWDGDEGTFWSARADRFNEGVRAYQPLLLAAARLSTTSDVLDIGCGTGQTARDAARLAQSGSVTAVDLSSSMLALARELAAREGLTNITFRQADAQVYPFPAESVDVVISRHGSMFFGDASAAFANLARTLRPGGRLALLTWQPMALNPWMSTFRSIFVGVPDGPTPAPRAGSLSDPDLTRELLTSTGFTDVTMTDMRRPMYFGRDVDDAADFISGQYGWRLELMSETQRAAALKALRDSMSEHLTDDGVQYDSAAWLIEARRVS